MKKLFIFSFVILTLLLTSCAKVTVEEKIPEKEPGLQIQTFDMPEKEQYENYTFGKEGDKTVAEQRQEIKDGMDLAISTKVTPSIKYYPEYKSDREGYEYIDAITFDCLKIAENTVRTFAYLGFPEGASKDNPVPAVVLVTGGNGYPSMDWVKIWNDRGYAAICVSYNGYFPKAPGTVYYKERDITGSFVHELTGDFYEEGFRRVPTQIFKPKYDEVENHWQYHAVSQLIFAHNVMIEDERVDSKNIGVSGIAWGGLTVTSLIGYDNRFSFAIPIYGHAYLGDEIRSTSNFEKPYVDALWAAERNLDNATMPILWMAYSNDPCFAIPQHVNSYKHSLGQNPKNTLSLIGAGWSHSNNSAFAKIDPLVFADWVTFGKAGYVTFLTQPEGREVDCKINIPENFEGEIQAHICYLTSPMEYVKQGDNYYLKERFKTKKTALTVDTENGTLKGTVPEDAKGYYVNLKFDVEGQSLYSSSIYVEIEDASKTVE
ncbi:MAG: hypothetical protein E7582_04485 [Ruminococcaceae bacterium]|nr:hypothetical protein [Oscillospiraceae bacterium]